MNEHEIVNWPEFHDAVHDLSLDRHRVFGIYSTWLFRGQASAEWALSTTLERWEATNTSLDRHYERIYTIRPEIESRTGERWDILTPQEFRKRLNRGDIDMRVPRDREIYEYMVFLRHHGFPSPLLDWSRSPYVAAYFAFANANEDDDVAIFAYREFAGGSKMAWEKEARIDNLGPNVRSPARHFAQQSEYTVCFGKDDKSFVYRPHAEAFASSQGRADQLHKFVFPGRLRAEVLRYLLLHNITAFSLFGSEDSLMESLAIRTFVLQGNT